MKIRLTAEAIEHLSRPVRGSGGFQSLLRRLQANFDSATGELAISESDTEKLIRYAINYGQGGFQDRLKTQTRNTDSRG